MSIISPIIIACKERYAKCAEISIETFLKYHDVPLYVVVDEIGVKRLSKIKSKNFFMIQLGKYRKDVEKAVEFANFFTYDYDEIGDHDRAYSTLKPLIMDRVITDISPKSEYILSLDADTLFSGNILNTVVSELNKVNHKFDIYMVERSDPRMLRGKARSPGSGFTLWKRKGKFIPLFQKRFKGKPTGTGSQNLINQLRGAIPSRLFRNPLLHMVSPDLQNPHLTDKEILKMKPAYIHLHGKDCHKRLLKFKKIFEGGKIDACMGK